MSEIILDLDDVEYPFQKPSEFKYVVCIYWSVSHQVCGSAI